MKHITKHFSHEHALIFNDEKDIDSDNMKPKFCSLCGVIIFINSYYTCSRVEHGCHFLMHEQCAHKLPQELTVLPNLNPSEVSVRIFTFSLLDPNDIGRKDPKCFKCFHTCKNYVYINPWASLHPLCGVPLETVTKHRSHEHPLVPTRREIRGFCSACGEEERGIFLSCQTCDYWISHDCALLPPVSMHVSHSHPLVLLYPNFDTAIPHSSSPDRCEICGESTVFKSFYSCRTCRHHVHLRCVKSSIKDATSGEWRKWIVHLPAAKVGTVLWSLITNLEQNYDINATNTSIITSTPKEIHEHPLIFHEVFDNQEIWESNSKLLCNACINPINSTTPYYSCSVAQCHFLVHEFCAKLPSRIKGKLLNNFTMFLYKKWGEFFSVFTCNFCQYYCNGFVYSINPKLGSSWMNLCIDVECASAPRIIKHESHKNHYLYLAKGLWYGSSATSCCYRYHAVWTLYYECTICLAFKIHLRCALLPREVGHKFDKHHLRLITDGGDLSGLSMKFDREYLENYGFCEVCEKPMDPRIWFYYCSECDQYFHVKCIPSVGKLSKMKFGGTLDRVGCHVHPVTCVRMLTIGTQKCTYCKKLIQGFEDDWAFHCQSCNVWIHNDCAQKSINLSIEN